MMRPGTLRPAILALLMGLLIPNRNCLAAEHFQPQNGAFATPLTDTDLDDASFAEWSDGVARPTATPAAVRQVLWTLGTAPATSYFVNYGASNKPGIRHLRIGFTKPIGIGSILVRGGGELSVLRPNAPYPGNLADDSEWIPASRIVVSGAERQLSKAEVPPNGFALWVLPPNTQTRALRFSHTAVPTDSNYAGTLGSLYVLSGRFTNLAPQASIFTSSNGGAARFLHNETYDVSSDWDNGPDFDHPVSAARPEWITLVWPKAVALRGLAALMAGFNAADAQIFAGPENAPVRGAPESDWQPAAPAFALRSEYPLSLAVDWMDFGKTVQTRAVRLRLTESTDEEHHPHLKGMTRGGDRVWLDELMAIAPVPAGGLQAEIVPEAAAAGAAAHPPIPVRFSLAAPAYVSLVIEDAQGNRVRNLVSDTLFPAGQNTAWWDGSDDLSRDREAADHGQYYIPTHFVSPGAYRVRGIAHQAIDLRYQFTIYTPGNPPWETLDGKGGWLTNHTPPSAALFLPASRAPGGKPLVYIGCYIAEGGSGLAWLDLDGNKQGGRGSVGGAWTAAQFLARDDGPQANPDISVYAAATWGDDKAQGQALSKAILRLTGLGTTGSHADKPILSYTIDLGQQPADQPSARVLWKQQIGGLAVRNHVAVLSLQIKNKLLFVDTANGNILGSAPVESPRGLAFDAHGDLFVLSGTRLLRYAAPDLAHPQQLAAPQVLVSRELDSPSGIVLDADGSIYVSDQGDSNQVKVFSQTGKFLRAIGHPGPSKAGPYDAEHMNNPRGLAIDSNRHLWVAEEDFQPKRVSLWTLDGSLIKAFYGPTEYGGGGSLDPTDKSKFYYHAMEFKLDWTHGTSTLASVLRRDGSSDFPLPRFGTPESVDYAHGHRYFDNTWVAYPSNGVSVAMIYLDTGGVIRPVAALGRANDWSVLRDKAFASSWPPGTNPNSVQYKDQLLFTWSDLNNDGKVDPSEVTFVAARNGSGLGSVTAMPDLALVDSYVDGKAVRYAPVRFTPEGIPIYDIHAGQVIAEGAQPMSGDGGGQAIYSPSEVVLTTAPAPFSRDGLGGIDSQGHRWSYPSLWPGLHPAHSAPVPDHPGEVEGTTRLLGGFVHPAGGDAGPLWAINGNFGAMYLFTADGFYVTQLFQDVRVGKPWNIPVAQREMLVNDLSPHDENFFPSMTQTPDGKVYLCDGNHAAVIRLDGLNSIHRLPDSMLEVTKSDIDSAQSYLKEAEAERQSLLGPQTLHVAIEAGRAPTLDSVFEAMKAGPWAAIDQRIVKQGWADRPDLAKAAVAVAGDRLYAAFRTNQPEMLANSGAIANAPFKTGGALDLMVGADPHANPARTAPVAGDVRLLVYRVNGQIKATLYRAVVPGTKSPVPFSSPWRTITLDQVQDVSSLIQFQALAGPDAGTFVFSIPLETLGLRPVAGERIKADLGLLRGSPVETLQRVYWSNKATGITADVPSEAELTPDLWGEWVFTSAP